MVLDNTAGALPGVERPLPGIDLRADGGYIVAPPSQHRSGVWYQWEDVAVEPEPAPTWLRPAVRRVAAGDGLRGPVTQGGSRYGLSALRREVETLAAAVEGERNNRLNRAAWSLGMLVAGGELEEHTVVEELRQAAAVAGLDSSETEATIASGLAAGAERPRRRPER